MGAAAASLERYRVMIGELGIPRRSRAGTLEHVLQRVDARPRGRVLDAPCGPGLSSAALQHLGFDVTAADVDARQFERHGSIPFCTLDLDSPLPFASGVFTLVNCGDGIEHLENPFRLLGEFSRALEEGGLLIIVTPNYLNIESRLRFLLTGESTRPLERRPGFDRTHSRRATRPDRGHINPLTLSRLARMAEYADLVLVEGTSVLSKPRQRLLAPLAAVVWFTARFLRPRDRERLFASHTQSWRALLGGKQLLAVFEKRSRNS